MLKYVEMYTSQWNVQDSLFEPFIMVSPECTSKTITILEWYILILRMETAHLPHLVLLIYVTVCIFSSYGTGIKCL